MDYVTEGEVEDSELPLAHRAATSGDTLSLMSAIKADPAVLEHHDTDGLTPLSHATMSEQLDSLKLLVKMGASINAQDNLGRTCLSMAAYQGWYDGVVFLLRNGAWDHICDKAGRSPLHSATYDVDTKVLSALLQNMSQEQVSSQDNEGMAALHWSCFHNRPQHTQMLLDKGANIFSHDIDGKTALHWAAQKGSVGCTQHLLDNDSASALVNATDFSGKTPLHFASAAGHTDIIRELAHRHPLEVNCEDPDERTPLHWAAAMGQSQAVSSLLELNANPNPMDLEQGTPLDYAKQSGHTDCVEILEEHLGIRGSHNAVQDPSGESGSNQNSSSKPNRKGPLDFIVDLFKTKKSINAKGGINDNDHSSNVNNNLRGRNQAARALRGTSNGERMSTPKKIADPEMLISMEKLQVSREDNPAMLSSRSTTTSNNHKGNSHHYGGGSTHRSNRDPGYELGEIHASHTQNIPLGGAGRTVLPASINDTNLDHSHLIRSPPPALKRESSPIVSGGVWNTEKDHDKLEEDAATILALQKNKGIKNSGPLPPMPSLSPIKKVPDLPLGMGGRRAQTMTPSAIGGGYTSISPGGESVSSTKSHPPQLAPLRGPVPPSKGVQQQQFLQQQQPLQLGASPNGPHPPPIHKRLEGLRTEAPPPSRTPTPPPSMPLPPAMTHDLPLLPVQLHSANRRDNSPLASTSRNRCNSIDGPSANSQRKKKKKKTKTLASDLRGSNWEQHDSLGGGATFTATLPNSNHYQRKLGDPYLDAVDNMAARRSHQTLYNSDISNSYIRGPPPPPLQPLSPPYGEDGSQ